VLAYNIYDEGESILFSKNVAAFLNLSAHDINMLSGYSIRSSWLQVVDHRAGCVCLLGTRTLLTATASTRSTVSCLATCPTSL
jgi:hypothetical protein